MSMELHAVHDSQGIIVAASLVEPEGESVPIPQAGDGTVFVRIELDEAQTKMPLERLCTTFRVDPGTKALVVHDAAR